MFAKAVYWIGLILWALALFTAAYILKWGIDITARILKTGHKRIIRFLGVIFGLFFAVFGGMTSAIGINQFMEKGDGAYTLNLDAWAFIVLILFLAALILKLSLVNKNRK